MTKPLTVAMTPSFFYEGDWLLRAQLRCLSEQRAKDFDVLLVDSHYKRRRAYIAELADHYRLSIVHVPYQPNLHVAKTLDCAIFNAAYCYAESPRIVRLSCWRFVRPDFTEVCLNSSCSVDFWFHNCVPPSPQHADPVTEHDTRIWSKTSDVVRWDQIPQQGQTPGASWGRDSDVDSPEALWRLNCYGNYMVPRDKWFALNGADETFTNLVHYEDVDFGIRARHAGLTCSRISHKMYRLHHQYGGHAGRANVPPDYTFRRPCASCAEALQVLEPNRFDIKRRASRGEIDVIAENVWICPRCLLCGPVYHQDPAEHLNAHTRTRSLVLSQYKIGRDLRVLAGDMDGKSLDSKISIFNRSWSDPRYYGGQPNARGKTPSMLVNEEKKFMANAPEIAAFHKLFYARHTQTWYGTRWLGTVALKSPLDLWIYQEIIQELRPALVVEIGTLHGGTALFLASVCDQLKSGRVISIDVAPQPDLPSHPRLTYVQGFSTDPAIVEHVHKAAAEAKGPVVVILDSDHKAPHVLAELRAYQDLVGLGGYLIVEDTNVNGHPVLPDFGPGPYEAVDLFLAECSDFVRDHDRERYLMTFNPGGFLRRIAVPGSNARAPQRSAAREIEELYFQAKQVPSDINEHVAYLRQLGEQCGHITEFGVRMGTSTTAWVAARPKKLVCYDIGPQCSEVAKLERVAKGIDVAFSFHQQDVLSVTIEPTDLLFIDTLHTYDQLRQELALHESKARKYIVLHDTETYGQLGEGCKGDAKGLWHAVIEFVAGHPEWVIREKRSNNNGLTVLARVA